MQSKSEVTTTVYQSGAPLSASPQQIAAMVGASQAVEGMYTEEDLEKARQEFMKKFREQQEAAAIKAKEAKYFVALGITSDIPKYLR